MTLRDMSDADVSGFPGNWRWDIGFCQRSGVVAFVFYSIVSPALMSSLCIINILSVFESLFFFFKFLDDLFGLCHQQRSSQCNSLPWKDKMRIMAGLGMVKI